MKANTKMFQVLTVVASLTACGGDNTAPNGPAPDRNNPGTGSSTLLVAANVDASDGAAGFVTDFTASVRDAGGNPVSGAQVTMANSLFGTVGLTETAPNSGDYAATRTGFADGDFALEVVRGSDNVRNVVLGGPGVFAITTPTGNATVPGQQALAVAWTVPSQALSAEIETRDYGPVPMPDVGTFDIPAGSNPTRDDQRIRVFRYNEVDLAGGRPGSRLRIKIRQTVEPVVVQ